MTSRIYIFSTILLFLLTAWACNNEPGKESAKGEDPSITAILENQPFAVITDSIKRFPGNAALYQRRAYLLMEHKKAEAALADFRKAWELDKSETSAKDLSGIIFILKRQAEYLPYLEIMTKQFAQNGFIRAQYADGLYKQGKPKEALVQNEPSVMAKAGLVFNRQPGYGSRHAGIGAKQPPV
jgi:tetratricopeptide (TPR) repeat protein